MTTTSSSSAKPSPFCMFVSLLAVPARFVVAGVFIWAAWKKLAPFGSPNPPQVFSSAITAYKLNLPEFLVKFSTFAVPWTELVAGVVLVLGLWTRASATVIGAMLLLFIGLGMSALLRNPPLEINCGCFGDRSLFCTGGLGWCHVGENSFLTALCVLCIFARPMLGIDHAIAVNRRP